MKTIAFPIWISFLYRHAKDDADLALYIFCCDRALDNAGVKRK